MPCVFLHAEIMLHGTGAAFVLFWRGADFGQARVEARRFSVSFHLCCRHGVLDICFQLLSYLRFRFCALGKTRILQITMVGRARGEAPADVECHFTSQRQSLSALIMLALSPQGKGCDN